MKSSISEHAHFEELRALAAIGEISPAEYQELSDHIAVCAVCREAYGELTCLTHSQLPLVAAEKLQTPKLSDALARIAGHDYKARFAARALEHGLEISSGKSPAFSFPRLSYQQASIAAIIVLVVTVGTMWRNSWITNARYMEVTAHVSKLSQQNAILQEQVQALSQERRVIASNPSKALNDSNDTASHLRDLEDRIRRDDLALQNLAAQVSTANEQQAQTEQKLRGTEQTLLAANQQIAELRESHTENDAAAAGREVQLAELSRQVKDQGEVIEKQQKLLSVDTDVRSLMAARSLHITDVFDVDGKGKKKRAFGRVFYTEDKSLIFYAFDLDAPKSAGDNHSFQAWGQLADSSNGAINLGIFYVDDPAQKRWMLKFDNLEVLKQVSAVFVTAEPHGGRERPSGQKLMYAYLGHEPNHP